MSGPWHNQQREILAIERRVTDLVILGDSKSSQGLTAGATAYGFIQRGWWTHAIETSGVPFNVKAMLAAGGYTLEQIAATVPTAISTLTSGGWAFFYGGCNNIYKAVSTQSSEAEVKALIQGIYDRLIAAGINVLRVGIPPIDSSQGYMSRSLTNKVHRINAWDKEYCRQNGILFVDPWLPSIFGIATDAQGDMASGVYYDGVIHESNNGAYLLGKAAGDLIAAAYGREPELVESVTDAFTNARITLTSISGDGTTATAAATAHPYQPGETLVIYTSSAGGANAGDYYGAKTILDVPTPDTFTYACTQTGATSGTLYASNGTNYCDNPLMAGTAGTKTGDLAGIVGPISDGWNAAGSSGMTITASQENHTSWDALPGSTDAADEDGFGLWQKFDITAAASGNTLSFTYTIPDGKSAHEGDYYTEIECELFGTISNLRECGSSLTVNWTNTDSSVDAITLSDGVRGSVSEEVNADARKFILRTPKWSEAARIATGNTNTTLIPEGYWSLSTTNAIKLTCTLSFLGAGSASVRFGRAKIKADR